MKTIKTKLYVLKCPALGDIYVASCRVGNDIVIGEHYVDVPIPEFTEEDERRKAIDSIFERMAEIETEAQQQIDKLNKQLEEIRA